MHHCWQLYKSRHITNILHIYRCKWNPAYDIFQQHFLVGFLIGRREPDDKRDHKFRKPICWGRTNITATCDNFYLQSYNTNTTCCDLITLNFYPDVTLWMKLKLNTPSLQWSPDILTLTGQNPCHSLSHYIEFLCTIKLFLYFLYIK